MIEGVAFTRKMGPKNRLGNTRNIGVSASRLKLQLRLQLRLQLQHPYKNQR